MAVFSHGVQQTSFPAFLPKISLVVDAKDCIKTCAVIAMYCCSLQIDHLVILTVYLGHEQCAHPSVHFMIYFCFFIFIKSIFRLWSYTFFCSLFLHYNFQGGEQQTCDVTAQMVLVCCWRSMKEISLLLGKLCQLLPLQAVPDCLDVLITEEQVWKFNILYFWILDDLKQFLNCYVYIYFCV